MPRKTRNLSLSGCCSKSYRLYTFDAGICRSIGSCLHQSSLFFKIDGILKEVVMQSSFLAGTFLAAWVLLKNWDHLPITDLGLSLKGRAKDIFWGTFVALAIYTVGFGILYGLEEIEITAVHFSAYDFLLSWILMLLVALAEEIAFRGFVLGHLLTAGVNRFVALFLSSALFSLMHIFNPNFSLIAFLNILLAGILIGSTYIYTRNLWFPIALHLFWNWLQGPILGFEVSGGRLGGTLLSLELPEENIITAVHSGSKVLSCAPR